MSKFIEPSVFHPELIVAKEEFREVAEEITGAFGGDGYLYAKTLHQPRPTEIIEVLADIGMGKFLDITGTNSPAEDAEPEGLELRASYQERDMVVSDLALSKKQPKRSRHITIPGQHTWLATLGIAFPYTFINAKHKITQSTHSITIYSEQSDKPPEAVSALHEIEYRGEERTRTERTILRSTVNTDTLLAFGAFVHRLHLDNQKGQ